jgi:hypothetical protein
MVAEEAGEDAVSPDEAAREIFQHLPLPYPDGRFPANLGAVVQRTVLTGERPALEVVHAPDGSWAVSDGVNDPNLPDAAVATHIHHAIERNSSITQLATMQPGQIARRSGPGEQWMIYALEGWDE